MNKAVAVNGDFLPWTTALREGDSLSIRLSTHENDQIIPSIHSLDVLFEDDHLLIVNKPAGMATHPNILMESNTLANIVAYYLQNQNDFRKIRHIHRLDKDTTGAVMFAKHALSHAVLDQMFLQGKIERTYYALAEGIMQKKRGVINQPIGRDRHHPTRRRVSITGQTAITHYQVLNTFPKSNITLLECSLETGRTHQIRVHLSHIGHPLMGDRLYGGKPIFPRQALHARKLAFIHPFTMNKIEYSAPFLDKPPIFNSFL